MSDEQHPVVTAVLADPAVKAALADEGADAAPPSAFAAQTGQAGQAGQLGPAKPDVMILPSGQPVAAPKTTEEEDRGTAGQRAVNIIWENTQMRIALRVVGTVLASNILVIGGMLYILITSWEKLADSSIAILITVLTAALGALAAMGSLVIGFYFGRTNHQRVGGVVQGR